MIGNNFVKFNKLNSSRTATKLVSEFQSEIFSLASELPQSVTPSLANQMAIAITKINDYLYKNNDYFVRQNQEVRNELIKNIRTEINILTLLTQLAFEKESICSKQSFEIMQKIAACEFVLFLNSEQSESEAS